MNVRSKLQYKYTRTITQAIADTDIYFLVAVEKEGNIISSPTPRARLTLPPSCEYQIICPDAKLTFFTHPKNNTIKKAKSF